MKVKYGPWRMVKKEGIHHYEVRWGQGGYHRICGVYYVYYHRKTYLKGDRCPFIERKEERRTVDLGTALEKIHLTEQQYSMVELTMAGISVVERIFNRYESFLRREENKRYEKGRKEWRRKRNLRRVVQEKLPTRMVEL